MTELAQKLERFKADGGSEKGEKKEGRRVGQSVLWRARVEKNEDVKMLRGITNPGNVEEGSEVSYLYCEGEFSQLSFRDASQSSFADAASFSFFSPEKPCK